MKERLGKIFSGGEGSISQDLLLRYVNDDVTTEERRLVEKRLADDPFLWDAVEGLMLLKDDEKVRQHLSDIRERITEAGERKEWKIILMNRWIQAAAVLLVLIAGTWYVNSIIQPDTQKIFSDEFRPYPAPVVEPAPPIYADSAMTGKKENKEPVAKKNPESKEQLQADKPPSLTPSKNTVQDAIVERDDVPATAYEMEEVAPSEMIDEAENVSVARESKSKQYNADTLYDKKKELDQAFKTERSISAPSSLNEVIVSKQSAGANDEMLQQQELQVAKLNSALDLYHQEKYAEAIQLFETILNDNPDDVASNFYAGVSYLAIQNPDAALEKLKKADNNKDGYYEAALWYESLAFVQQGKTKDAINTLQKVVKLNGEFKPRAEDLLEKLK